MVSLYQLSNWWFSWGMVYYFPIKSHSTTIFLWYSYGFPMGFLWFSYGFPMKSFPVMTQIQSSSTPGASETTPATSDFGSSNDGHFLHARRWQGPSPLPIHGQNSVKGGEGQKLQIQRRIWRWNAENRFISVASWWYILMYQRMVLTWRDFIGSWFWAMDLHQKFDRMIDDFTVLCPDRLKHVVPLEPKTSEKCVILRLVDCSGGQQSYVFNISTIESH